jgi:hypothetical protein
MQDLAVSFATLAMVGVFLARAGGVTAMSDEQGGELSGEAGGPDEDEDEEALRKELAENMVQSRDLPLGYQLEGPAEPGADADVPGVLGGPGITIISEDEDEPGNRWPEHPR